MNDMDNRRAEIVKLRAAGLTLAAIGEQYGISRERVRQILSGPQPRKSSPHAYTPDRLSVNAAKRLRYFTRASLALSATGFL